MKMLKIHKFEHFFNFYINFQHSYEKLDLKVLFFRKLYQKILSVHQKWTIQVSFRSFYYCHFPKISAYFRSRHIPGVGLFPE